MKTVLITINEYSDAIKGYPVNLYSDEDGTSDWQSKSKASSVIPENLVVKNPPTYPRTQSPIEGKSLRRIFLKDSTISELYRNVGEYLYQLLFENESMGQAWETIKDKYQKSPNNDGNTKEGFRTYLDIKADDLKLLPWELLYQSPFPLFFDSSNPIIRGVPNFSSKVLPSSMPIRVLIVVGSEPDDPDVLAEEEILAIEQAFAKSKKIIDWEILYRPLQGELVSFLESFQPEIFHFIGHGSALPGTNRPALDFYNKKDPADSWQWSAHDISTDLLRTKLRIAFVNACRNFNPDDQTKTWEIRDAFVNAGVSAVITMQGDVKGEVAKAFSKTFYSKLLNEDSLIDEAMVEARKSVKYLPPPGIDKRDWGLATLQLSVPPEHVLQIPFNHSKYGQIELDLLFDKIRDFTDRRPLRRSVWDNIDPKSNSASAKELLIVTGENGLGKTSLIKSCLKASVLRGRNVLYVNVGDTTRSFLSVLNLIRKGDVASSALICKPLPDEFCVDFDTCSTELINKTNSGAPASNEEIFVVNDQNLVERLFSSFKDALLKTANGDSLIIVLDNLKIRRDHFLNYMKPYFIDPLARREYSPVKLVLVADSTEMTDFNLNSVLGAEVLNVPLLNKSDYIPLVQEICHYNDIDCTSPGKMAILRGIEVEINEKWEPKILRHTLDILKSLRQ